MRLIHGPTVTPQFPCLEDYGNFHVFWRMDQTLKTSWLVHGDLSVFFFFFRRVHLGGKIFEFPVKKISRRFAGPRRRRSFNAPNQVVEARPRVEVGVVERAAVIMTGQPSKVEAFSGISKRLSMFSECFFFLSFNARLFSY
jgi:hypothetical protein